MYRSVLWALAFAIGVTPQLSAQQAHPITVGDRVRIRSALAAGQFTVERLATDTLVLRRSGNTVPLALPLAAIDRLDVSRGLRSRGELVGRGLGFGFLIGGAIGGVLGLTDGDDKDGFFQLTAGEKAGILGLALGAGGAVVGGVMGAAKQRDRWERVDLATVSAADLRR